MASTDFVYATARLALNSAQIDLASATVGAALVSGGYSPNPNTDQFLSAIDPTTILAQADLTDSGLGPAGQFFGTIPQFMALLSVPPVVAVVLYVDTGDPTTSQLLYYSSTGPGFPFLPQGFNYVVGYDQTQGGFFQ